MQDGAGVPSPSRRSANHRPPPCRDAVGVGPSTAASIEDEHIQVAELDEAAETCVDCLGRGEGAISVTEEQPPHL